jgi:hypothetical protein
MHPCIPHRGHEHAEMYNFHGIFEYKYSDIDDDYNKVFYDVTLLIPMGKYSAGDEVDSAYWKTDELTLYIDDDTVGMSAGCVTWNTRCASMSPRTSRMMSRLFRRLVQTRP